MPIILNERNCPILKYIRWEDSLWKHPDFRRNIVPAGSDLWKDTKDQVAKRCGEEFLKKHDLIVYIMSQLGDNNFLKPVTTQYGTDLLEKTRGMGEGEKVSVYIDMPFKPGMDDNAEPNPKEESLKGMTAFDYDDGIMYLYSHWGENVGMYNQEIDIVSHSFWEAMMNSRDAFLKPDILKELEGFTVHGTIIVPTENHLVLFYNLRVNKILEGQRIDVDGNCFQLRDYSRLEAFVTDDEYLFVDPSVGGGDKESDQAYVGEMIYAVLVYNFFKKYADVRFRNVKNERRNLAAEGVKVNTMTPNVNYVDCTWFTTIIRNEGFKVRGHFRLQPYGPGRTEKKLVYINEFEKHGYVRRAKIESLNNG